jgi:hypothetical protein
MLIVVLANIGVTQFTVEILDRGELSILENAPIGHIVVRENPLFQ